MQSSHVQLLVRRQLTHHKGPPNDEEGSPKEHSAVLRSARLARPAFMKVGAGTVREYVREEQLSSSRTSAHS